MPRTFYFHSYLAITEKYRWKCFSVGSQGWDKEYANVLKYIFLKNLCNQLLSSGIFQSAQGCQSCVVGMERCCALSETFFGPLFLNFLDPPLCSYFGDLETEPLPLSLAISYKRSTQHSTKNKYNFRFILPFSI